MSFLQRLANRFQRKPADSGSGADNSMLGDTVSQDMYALDASMTVQGAPDAMPGDAGAVLDQETVVLPLLGRAPAARHQRTLSTLLGVSVLALVLAAAWALRQADGSAQQLAATGQALMQSQRLAKSVSQALTGAAPSFADVQDSAGVLARNVRALTSGDDSMGVRPLGGAYADELGQIMPLMERAEQSAKVVMEQKQILTQVGDALRTINRQSSDLLEIAETISSLKLQHWPTTASTHCPKSTTISPS